MYVSKNLLTNYKLNVKIKVIEWKLHESIS